MREKHQRLVYVGVFTSTFGTRSAEKYEQWRDVHWMELCYVERYWEARVELVYALKEGATSSSLVVHVVKTEQVEDVFVVDVEEILSGEPKE